MMGVSDLAFGPGQRDVQPGMGQRKDAEALSDGLHRSESLQQLLQFLRIETVDLDIQILSFPSQYSIPDTASDIVSPAVLFFYPAGDRLRQFPVFHVFIITKIERRTENDIK